MSQPIADSFYNARDEVQRESNQLKARFQVFEKSVNFQDSTYSEGRRGLVKELKSCQKKLQWLKDGLDQVEKNRFEFAHIKDSELASRKRFVNDTDALLADIMTGLNSLAMRKMENENKYENNAYAPSSRDVEKENDSFINNQSQQATQIMNEQGELIVNLNNAVGRLIPLTQEIKQELDDQGRMFDSTAKDMEKAQSRIDQVNSQVRKLLGAKDGCQIWTVIVLAVILILLICLVVWT